MLRHANLDDILLVTRDPDGHSQITRPADSEVVRPLSPERTRCRGPVRPELYWPCEFRAIECYGFSSKEPTILDSAGQYSPYSDQQLRSRKDMGVQPAEASGARTDLLRSISSMNADYLLLGDIDERPCVTATKETITNQSCRIDLGSNSSGPARNRSMVLSWTRRGGM